MSFTCCAFYLCKSSERRDEQDRYGAVASLNRFGRSNRLLLEEQDIYSSFYGSSVGDYLRWVFNTGT